MLFAYHNDYKLPRLCITFEVYVSTFEKSDGSSFVVMWQVKVGDHAMDVLMGFLNHVPLISNLLVPELATNLKALHMLGRVSNTELQP